MKKKYIIPASRIHDIRCASMLLNGSSKITVSNDETQEQLVKEQASWSKSGSGNWDTKW